MSANKCRHCDKRIVLQVDIWFHVINDRSFLLRCQDHNVPYGCEAHPRGTACPEHCLGSRQDVGS